MEKIINFLLDNYIYVLFLAILLILALIGYLIDSNRKVVSKKNLEKEEKEPNISQVMKGAQINMSINNVNNNEVGLNKTSKEK